MDNSLSRQILLSILGIAILIVAVVGVSYAVFTTSMDGSKINVINSGTISMSFVESSNGILINNAMPISNEEGKRLIGENNVFDFVVSSSIAGATTVNYEIVAEKVLVNGEELSNDDVKIYLEKMVNGEYVSTSITEEPKGFIENGSISEVGSKEHEMTLHCDSFQNLDGSKKVFSDNYRLRMWVSDTTVIDDVSKTFQIKINVYGKVL